MAEEKKIENMSEEIGKSKFPDSQKLLQMMVTEVFKAGVEWRDEDILTKDEAKEALETINDIASFAAFHGGRTTPIPSLVKLCNYLKERSK